MTLQHKPPQKWKSFLRSKIFENYEFLKSPTHLQSISLWAASISVGFSSVLYAKLFSGSERLFNKITEVSPISVFIISPVLFLISWIIVKKYSPEAGGSGIPQIMAANELEYSERTHSHLNKLLGMKTVGVKVVSSILCVIGGGAIGREGPTLQISASIFHFFGAKTRKYLPNVSEHIWIVAGATSGLASAFNTPLGGIVYAIEELGLVHFSKIRTALISGVIVSGLMAQWLLGSYLYLGLPNIKETFFSAYPTIFLIATVSGFLGAIFGTLLIRLLNFRLRINSLFGLVSLTLICGLIMASFSYLSKNSGGTGIHLISNYLFLNETADLKIIFIRFFGTIVTYISGCAGGIFSPSLTIGAALGSFLSQLLNSPNSQLMVLIGMIAFLTGVTRTPFTSFILVLEMTDRHSAIFPMMLAALTAQWMASFVDKKSFYEYVKDKYILQIEPPNL